MGYFLNLICFAFQNQVFHAMFVIQVNMGVDHHDIANGMLHGSQASRQIALTMLIDI